MLSVPDQLAHRTKFADWLEFKAISAPDGRVGFSTLISAVALTEDEQEDDIGEEDAEEDRLIQNAQEEIARRLDAVGPDYPFRVNDTGRALCFISPVTGAGSIYLFCLFMSHAFDRSIIAKKDAPKVDNRVRDLFQACSTLAAGGYVFGPAISFGWPRPDGSTYLKALHRVYASFGDGTPNQQARPGSSRQVKDSGIDIIAWRRAPDRLPGTQYLVAQVASGNNWRGKSVITSRMHFHDYWFSRKPASQCTDAMFMPFDLEPELPGDSTPYEQVLKDHMQSIGYEFGMLFYRHRIAYHAANGIRMIESGELEIERRRDLTQNSSLGEYFYSEAPSRMIERHRFHSICPYFAMFPEAFVRKNVLAWSKRDDVILDPFSGRGTTIFESLVNGRKAIGCDTNPVAACLSRAKADPPRLKDIQIRLAKLEKESIGFSTKASETTDEFFTLCFHEATLRQILFLMKNLEWRTSRVDCFIAALSLGCLHGESHRTEACFSNRMPRTISTKLAYSVRWWQRNGCLPPKRDVFSILRTAADYRYVSEVPEIKGRVVEGDVRKASSMLRSYKQKVKLLITSPPYLDITDYHEDQWLRLWFLGGPTKPIAGQGKDDRHRIVDTYWNFLGEAWTGIAPLLQDSAQVVVRIGGTRLGQEELQEGLLSSLNATGHRFKLQEARHSDIKNSQARMFSAAAPKAAVEHDFRFKLC